MDVRKGKLLKDGQTKRVYATNVEELLVLSYKNEFPGPEKRETFKGKQVGKIASSISATVFKFLETYHIPTHFLEVWKPGELVVRKLDMVPVLVWVWNAASGSLSRRLGLEKGRIFDFPIVEMIWKNEALHYPMIQADHAVALGLAAAQDLQDMDRIARKINAVLKDFFARRNLKLVDLTLEFGLLHGVLKVGDDIGPESFRVWDIDKSGEFDLQRFSPGKRDSEEIIEELSNRITLH